MPVLIIGTYDDNGTPNAMNAAWGGIYDTNMVMVCLADDHKTTENIKKTGESLPSFCVLPHLSVALDNVFHGGKLGKSHRASRVELLR